MAYKSLDDVEREKEKAEREKFKEELSQDVEDVYNRIRGNIGKRKKKKQSIIVKIIKWLALLFLLIFVVDLLLGSVWLLKFFIKSLFHI